MPAPTSINDFINDINYVWKNFPTHIRSLGRRNGAAGCDILQATNSIVYINYTNRPKYTLSITQNSHGNTPTTMTIRGCEKFCVKYSFDMV